MSKSPHRSLPFARIVAVLASAFGVGVGLCGLDHLLAAHNIGRSQQEFGVGPLDGVSLFVMFFSAVGLVLTLIVWPLASLFHRSSRKSSDPPRLFDDSDKGDPTI
jgi:hypothetical protein